MAAVTASDSPEPRYHGRAVIPPYVRQRLDAVALLPDSAMTDPNVRAELVRLCQFLADVWREIPAVTPVVVEIAVTWAQEDRK